MKILHSWISKVSGILPIGNWSRDSQSEISSMGSEPNYNQRMVFSILICSSALFLTTMYCLRNNMKKNIKPEAAPESGTSKACSTVGSVMGSCINWFWSKDLLIQKLEELYKVRLEYGNLVEQQTTRIEEISYAMNDLQKDLQAEIKSNEIKLSELFQQREGKLSNKKQKNSENKEISHQYLQLQHLLANYPESKAAQTIDSSRRLDQLKEDISEVREKIKERTAHHQEVEFCYQELINRLRKELGKSGQVWDSPRQVSSVNMSFTGTS